MQNDNHVHFSGSQQNKSPPEFRLLSISRGVISRTSPSPRNMKLQLRYWTACDYWALWLVTNMCLVWLKTWFGSRHSPWSDFSHVAIATQYWVQQLKKTRNSNETYPQMGCDHLLSKHGITIALLDCLWILSFTARTNEHVFSVLGSRHSPWSDFSHVASASQYNSTKTSNFPSKFSMLTLLKLRIPYAVSEIPHNFRVACWTLVGLDFNSSAKGAFLTSHTHGKWPFEPRGITYWFSHPYKPMIKPCPQGPYIFHDSIWERWKG